MTQSRVWLPVLIGIIAAAGNYVLVSQATATHELVAVRGDLKPGTPITPADLRPVAVRADAPLLAGAIPYSARHSVYQLTVRRKVKEGELLLRADIENPAQQVEDPPPGFKSLTLAARPKAVLVRPAPGAHVELHVQHASSAPAGVYGPYLFLGCVAAPLSNRDQDVIFVTVAVPQKADIKELELRGVQERGSPDSLVAVELVGKARN